MTENIHPHTTRQGDIALLDIMEEMGCRIERETDRVVVHGGLLSGIEVDMGAIPDMVPTLAAIALFAEGKTTIRNVPHLRHKESDRLGDTALELRRLGSRVEERDDGLIIHDQESWIVVHDLAPRVTGASSARFARPNDAISVPRAGRFVDGAARQGLGHA